MPDLTIAIATKEEALAQLQAIVRSAAPAYVRKIVADVVSWLEKQTETELLEIAVPELPAGLMEGLGEIEGELRSARPPSDSVNEANLLRLTRIVMFLIQAMVDSGAWKLPEAPDTGREG